MKKLYYAGFALEKDLQFCEILKEVESVPGVYILSKPEEHNVIEMKYKNAFSPEREETGKTHIGYDYHYITFLYNGLVFSINASGYYPFTDVNYPGMWNFAVYQLTTPATKQQCSYNIKYENFSSITNYIIEGRLIKALKGTNKQNIDYHIHYGIEKQIKQIVDVRGGCREKEIYKKCFFVRSETWNDDHKVIDVLSVYPDDDGQRAGFAVDIVTGNICG